MTPPRKEFAAAWSFDSAPVTVLTVEVFTVNQTSCLVLVAVLHKATFRFHTRYDKTNSIHDCNQDSLLLRVNEGKSSRH